MKQDSAAKFVNRAQATGTLLAVGIMFGILLLAKQSYDRASWRLNSEGFALGEATLRTTTSEVNDVLRGRKLTGVKYALNANGREYIGEGVVESSRYAQGRTIKVLYDPRDPTKSITEYYGELESSGDRLVFRIGRGATFVVLLYGAYLIIWGVVLGRKALVPWRR